MKHAKANNNYDALIIISDPNCLSAAINYNSPI